MYILFLILMLATGLALLFAEVFVPGGIVAIAGGAILVTSVVLCYKHYGAMLGSVYLLVSVICTLGVAWAALRAIAHRFALTPPPPTVPEISKASLVGGHGEVVQTLHPSGTIDLEGKRYPARLDTSTEQVAVGTTVEVVGYDGIYLVVRRAEASETPR
jgi:membrane-bound serine protease (ClpP class)